MLVVDSGGAQVTAGSFDANVWLVGGGGASLSGTVSSRTSSAGVFTFAGLVISGPPGSYTLGFNSTVLGQLTVSGAVILEVGRLSRRHIVSHCVGGRRGGGGWLHQMPASIISIATPTPPLFNYFRPCFVVGSCAAVVHFYFVFHSFPPSPSG